MSKYVRASIDRNMNDELIVQLDLEGNSYSTAYTLKMAERMKKDLQKAIKEVDAYIAFKKRK